MGPSWTPPPYPVEVLLGRLRGEFNEGVLLEQWVGPDDKNSSANILQVRRQSKALRSATAQYNNRNVQIKNGADDDGFITDYDCLNNCDCR